MHPDMVVFVVERSEHVCRKIQLGLICFESVDQLGILALDMLVSDAIEGEGNPGEAALRDEEPIELHFRAGWIPNIGKILLVDESEILVIEDKVHPVNLVPFLIMEFEF